jgi:hypothetical protein
MCVELTSRQWNRWLDSVMQSIGNAPFGDSRRTFPTRIDYLADVSMFRSPCSLRQCHALRS